MRLFGAVLAGRYPRYRKSLVMKEMPWLTSCAERLWAIARKVGSDGDNPPHSALISTRASVCATVASKFLAVLWLRHRQLHPLDLVGRLSNDDWTKARRSCLQTRAVGSHFWYLHRGARRTSGRPPNPGDSWRGISRLSGVQRQCDVLSDPARHSSDSRFRFGRSLPANAEDSRQSRQARRGLSKSESYSPCAC
jgi:hypothetical protein